MIYKKMAAILADTTAIAKNKRNAAQGFNFRGIDDVMNELHSSFAKHGVFLTTEVLEVIREEKPTKSGGTMVHQFQKLKFSFCAEDGSSVSSTVIGEAMDSGDKSGNKCMSIGLKYALLQAFLIPTEDMLDPDQESPQIASKAAIQVKSNIPNPADNYTGTDTQKKWLYNLFIDLGITANDKDFMQKCNGEIQNMAIKQIADYIRPRAQKYRLEQVEADKS